MGAAFRELSPGGLWSLLDMINFFAYRVGDALGELHIHISVCNNNSKFTHLVGAQNLSAGMLKKQESAKEEVLNTIPKLSKLCRSAVGQITSPHIEQAIASLERMDADNFEWEDCKRRMIAVREAIRIELKQHYFYQYKRDKGLIFFNWKANCAPVLSSFPTAERDIFSAVDCYALEHNTASVFHSMRIAELGLRAVAAERELQLPKDKPIEWANWQEIIKALDDEIKRIGQMPVGSDKDKLLAFYSGARADLNGFKDEYRNVVMHVRIDFDEFQAASALTKVREFMTRLSRFGLSTV